MRPRKGGSDEDRLDMSEERLHEAMAKWEEGLGLTRPAGGGSPTIDLDAATAEELQLLRHVVDVLAASLAELADRLGGQGEAVAEALQAETRAMAQELEWQARRAEGRERYDRPRRPLTPARARLLTRAFMKPVVNAMRAACRGAGRCR